MYSRSERKFQISGKDSNPNLGPGCYLQDDEVLIAGKIVGAGGYAPFSSLAPRICYFDQQINSGPPPGNYDCSFGTKLIHRKEPAITFGKSKATRFKRNDTMTPGPNTYNPLETAKHIKRQEKLHLVNFGLNQKPVVLEQKPYGITSQNRLLQDQTTETASMIEDEDGNEISLVGKKSGTAPSRTSAKARIDNTLIWRRKYIPPSIPKGDNVFGYQENQDGELEPRKPPKFIREPEPQHIFSFAEKSRHEGRGNTFSKGSLRSVIQISDNPGPQSYDLEQSKQYLQNKVKNMNPALMTLAPCKRITDEIISDSLKKGIPGPGSYSIKAPLAERLSEPRMRIKIGGKGASTYINPEMLKIPGPGAYFPETTPEKPHSHKPKPFGSTSKRFSNAPQMVKSAPAVGSYDIDEITGLYNVAKKKNTVYMGQPVAAFGTISDRFIPFKPILQPGPGAYETNKEPSESFMANNEISTRRHLESRIKKLAHKGPTTTTLGQQQFLNSTFHVPVFGSQTTRFDDKVPDLPPPGAYEVSQAYDQLTVKAATNTAGPLISQTKRELFKASQQTPGPNYYTPALVSKKDMRKAIGAFLSTGIRFNERYDRIPGPGAYIFEEDSSLLKKTHNVTFREDFKQAIAK